MERPILVTTQYRGVFFGYADADPIDGVLTIRRARNCLYWPPATKGFLGLAANGPPAGSRVGPAADITLYGITCVATCTAKSVARWETFPWQ